MTNVTNPVQVREMRRAFYAGAIATLDGIMSNMDPSEDWTERDQSLSDDLVAELKQYRDDLQAGRA